MTDKKNSQKEFTTIHFVADDEIKAYLERRAAETDRNMSSYLRQIIWADMEKHGTPAERFAVS